MCQSLNATVTTPREIIDAGKLIEEAASLLEKWRSDAEKLDERVPGAAAVDNGISDSEAHEIIQNLQRVFESLLPRHCHGIQQGSVQYATAVSILGALHGPREQTPVVSAETTIVDLFRRFHAIAYANSRIPELWKPVLASKTDAQREAAQARAVRNIEQVLQDSSFGGLAFDLSATVNSVALFPPPSPLSH